MSKRKDDRWGLSVELTPAAQALRRSATGKPKDTRTANQKRIDADVEKYRKEQKRLDELKVARSTETAERLRAFEEPWRIDADKIRLTAWEAPTNFFRNVLRDDIERLTALPQWRDVKGAVQDLAFQFGMIFTIAGYWPAMRADPAQLHYFQGVLELSCRALETEKRIRTMLHLLARIAELQGAGQCVLSPEEVEELGTLIVGAYVRNVGPIGDDDVESDIFIKPKWKPSRLWREGDQKETAAAYFNEFIAPIPFLQRPTTIELAESQPQFFRALKDHCNNQRRYNREGADELGKAKVVSDILPIGTPRPRKIPKRRADPT